MMIYDSCWPPTHRTASIWNNRIVRGVVVIVVREKHKLERLAFLVDIACLDQFCKDALHLVCAIGSD